MELTWTVGKRRPVVVNVAYEMAAAIALDLGALPLDSPVIEGLEEWSELVLLLEPELGGVDRRKGKSALVSGLEVEIRREEMTGTQIQISSALCTAVDGSHC